MKKYMFLVAMALVIGVNADNVKNAVNPTIVDKYDAHDVNSDKAVDIEDVFAIYDAQAEGSTETIFDCNKDGSIDIEDVFAVYDCQSEGGDCDQPKHE